MKDRPESDDPVESGLQGDQGLVDDAGSISLSFDDPVPAGSESSVVSRAADHSHDAANDVARVLHAMPGVIVDTLAVRQLPNGAVLLEGCVEVASHATCDFAGSITKRTNVSEVIDRLRIRRTSALDETTFESPRTRPHLKG